MIWYNSRRIMERCKLNMIKEMDIPYAVLSEEGQLLWGNDKFLQVIVN